MTNRAKRILAADYDDLLADVVRVIEEARRTAARAINVVIITTYWFIGRRIVEQEQQGAACAAYGERVLKRLARDLPRRFGRGFSERNLEQMRAFYLGWPIQQTAGHKVALSSRSTGAADISQTASAKLGVASAGRGHTRFPLPWSHYVRLMAVKNTHARGFYEIEALRGGWTIRQLDRQIQSQFYERTALSRNKVMLLRKSGQSRASDPGIPAGHYNI